MENTLARRGFLKGLGLAAAAVAGGATLVALGKDEEADAAISLHSGCAARRVDLGYKAICPGCGWKSQWYPLFDQADSAARRHRKGL